MHRLVTLPGDPADGEGELVKQPPAPLLLLSSAETDLGLLAERLQQPSWQNLELRALNLAALQHPAAVDHYLRTTVAGARLVVVRLLGGRGHWSYGLERLRDWAGGRPHRQLLVLSGTADGEEDLISLGTVAPELARALGLALREGGPDNMDRLLHCCQVLLAGGQPTAPTVTPLPDPMPWDWRLEEGPRVGLLAYRALWSAGDTALLTEATTALRQRGLCPRVLLVSGLREAAVQEGVLRLLQREGVGLVLCATGFASVRADEAAAGAPLWRALGVPVLQLLSSGQGRERWLGSSVGLGPLDLSLQVALPELDGRITTRIVAFRELDRADDRLGCALTRHRADPEALAWVAELADRWLRLRSTPAAQRRVALVLANYPTRNARLANGVGLDTPASVALTLADLQRSGHDLGGPSLTVPKDGDGLVQALLAGRTPDPESDHRAPLDRLPVTTYRTWYDTLPADARAGLERHWGPPETDPSLEGDGFAIAGRRWGSVVVLLQPSRGYERDPALSYHSPDLPPTHAYLAHYLWLRQAFDAHVLVHFGKHGNLEWLPGKGLGLSPSCFPALALGPLPHLYPFIVNDPGEGSQAKRRSQAVILDHLTPPLGRAGLHGALAGLEALLEQLWQARELGSRECPLLEQQLEKLLATLALPIGDEQDDLDQRLGGLDGYLCELKEAQIRTGLHIYGQDPTAEALLELLLALARAPGPGRVGLTRRLAAMLDLELDPWAGDETEPLSAGDRSRLEALGLPGARCLGHGVALLEEMCLGLLRQRLAASDGGLTAPQDPPLIPEGTPAAREALEAELTQVLGDLWPRLRACGTAEREALATALAGGRVEAGPSGAPTRGRPDVLPTGRNFYSVDLRGLPTEAAWDLGRRSAAILLEEHRQQEGCDLTHLALSIWGTSTMRNGGDDVAQVLALLGVQPVWDGPTRRMVDLALIPAAQLGRPRVSVTVRISGFFRDAFPQLIEWLTAADRLVGDGASCAIYGSAPGAYGAGLQGLIDSGAWRDADDLAEAFLQWGQWRHRSAEQVVADRPGLEQRLREVQLVLHNQDNREHDLFDSDDYYQFQGGLAAAARRLQGRSPSLWFGDHSRPERPRPRPLTREFDRVIRSRLLNPRWIEGMQRHGYKGGFELAASLDYLFAYDACTDAVPDWAYGALCEAWLEQPSVRSFLERSNPWALRDLAERFLEAHHRGLWQGASADRLERLRQLLLESEAIVETAGPGTVSPGP
ncbi:MAG: cobaltochelatase subunit CobN [Synechococcus sp.]